MVAAPQGKAPAEAGSESVLVVRGWGRDQAGISAAFVDVVAKHSSRVIDLAQFLLDGALLFSMVLRVGEKGSKGLQEALSKRAEDFALSLDFHFPEPAAVAARAEASENVAAIAVVSRSPITPQLLCDLDRVLCSQGCTVMEIEHRSDNKLENNGEFNKVQLRAKCPLGVRLSSLYLGPPASEAGGLQQAAQSHGAEVTVRWWDAMNRPNGKSLVVFGLSHVLFPCDCLDEVLREAGVDVASLKLSGSTSQRNAAKVRHLAGQSTALVGKVLERIDFTPGARLVCGALKRLGFRLAVLTNTGVQEMAERAKRELGIDYAICQDLGVKDGKFTGDYAGELSDVRFRKADLLKLMADREGIECRNVIVVGEALSGLQPSSARPFLETFGPSVYFNSDKLKDLSIGLYLLGFNGSDVRALRKRRWAEGPGEGDGGAEITSTPPTKRVVMQVSSQRCGSGQIERIFAPLAPANKVEVATVRQCSLQDGGMCLGLELRVAEQDPDQLAQELLAACQKQGFEVRDVGKDVQSRVWKPYYVNRHVVTLVQKPQVEASALGAMCKLLTEQKANIVKIERLSAGSKNLAALQFVVTLPEQAEAAEFSALLADVARKHGADIAFQQDDLERWMRRLVVFDMDSTLIQQEVIDELAKIAGVEKEVSSITEAAMQGQLNFFDSLKSRVALLKGHKADELFAKVKENLIFTPGAKKLCSTLKRMGFKMAVISGGFLPVAQEVQKHLGLDYAFANTLEVDEATGLLTGCTSGPVVTPQRKRALLATIANVEGCEVQQTIAVGDGANDIPMLNAAGLGIAFCAKPKVQAATEFRINQKDLSTVLFLIGVSERAAERLTPDAAP